MKLICLPVTVQLVALEDFCPAFLQFVLRQLLWFFFVNLRNGISTSCKQEMLLQCLRLFSSYTQKIKAPLCDWKGHVVNLPIWTWVLFLNTCMLHQNSYCDVSARSHYIVGSLLILKRWCNALKTWISSCDLGAEEKEICVISAQEQHQRICLAPPHSP